MSEHVAPVLTVAQARALLAAAESAQTLIEQQRERFEPSTWTRRLAQTQRALRGGHAALLRVIPPDPADPGTPPNEGTP